MALLVPEMSCSDPARRQQRAIGPRRLQLLPIRGRWTIMEQRAGARRWSLCGPHRRPRRALRDVAAGDTGLHKKCRQPQVWQWSTARGGTFQAASDRPHVQVQYSACRRDSATTFSPSSSPKPRVDGRKLVGPALEDTPCEAAIDGNSATTPSDLSFPQDHSIDELHTLVGTHACQASSVQKLMAWLRDGKLWRSCSVFCPRRVAPKSGGRCRRSLTHRIHDRKSMMLSITTQLHK
jgi:hypothetical protein